MRVTMCSKYYFFFNPRRFLYFPSGRPFRKSHKISLIFEKKYENLMVIPKHPRHLKTWLGRQSVR